MNALGISIINSHPEAESISEQIRLFDRIGFDSFFLSSGVTADFHRIPEWADLAAGVGMEFEAVHAPTDGVNALWDPSARETAEAYMARLRRIIDFCGEGGVRYVVMHVAYGTPHPVTPEGLARLSTLEDYAAEWEVHLCYENAGISEHLTAAVRNAGPGHGFCHDTGHNLCYTPMVDYLPACGDKLLYTHLHDNGGQADDAGRIYPGRAGADLHLLPYDGVMDWSHYMKRLAAVGYRGTLNLELSCTWRSEYRQMTYPRFLEIAFERACRLRDDLCAHRESTA